MGRRADTLNPDDAPHSLLWLWAAIIVYNIALACVKLSILLQYLRILPSSVKEGPVDERHPPNKYRMATIAMIGVVSVFSSWAIISAIFTCWPVRRFWREDSPGDCLRRQTTWLVVTNTVDNPLGISADIHRQGLSTQESTSRPNSAPWLSHCLFCIRCGYRRGRSTY